jgi:GTPase SAR1 family protein
MAPHASGSASLEQLQSAEQVALLDAIDNLRNQGLGRYNISLPQLIVCGDQSSGKSSVLEGLTRLRFPTKDTVCTTFATELILRKGPKVEIECTINPANNRTQAQASELQKFRHLYFSHQDFSFPALVEEARKRMGIGKTSTDTFSEDVLKVQYTGPDVPSLTIVDLPGLVHFGTGADRVRDLVQGYMEDPRSIILAVVSAKNDWENQVVFKHAQQIDPTSSRTLGIITKPDTLPQGFSSEAAFVELAMNQKIPLTLGWHVVKNRKAEDQEDSIDKRDESEKLFFSSGIWNSLPRSDVGIDSLRVKLSKCLLRHIRAELPSLTMTIQEAITTTASTLKSLGDSRETHEQQRDYLILLAERFQHHTRDALQGSYCLPFFKSSSVEGYHKKTRLRTEIQNLNIAFAQAMYRKGHKWEIIDEDHFSPSEFGNLTSGAVEYYVSVVPQPTVIGRSEFLSKHIGIHVRDSRPAGLPSYVNPWVVGTVFKEQSGGWQHIAEGHLYYVFSAVQDYINVVVESLTDARTGNLLKRKHIDAQLAKRQVAYEAKLEELLKPFQEGDPIMYDPSFISELGEIRARRYLKNKTVAPGDISQSNVPSHHLLTQSLDDFTNCEILDLMQTYYKVSNAIAADSSPCFLAPNTN